MRLHKLKRVLSVDEDKKTITVEAGILLKELYKIMDSYRLAFPCLPNVDTITLAGAVANCTHGTCSKVGTFSDLVEEITLVTANPEKKLLILNRHD